MRATINNRMVFRATSVRISWTTNAVPNRLIRTAKTKPGTFTFWPKYEKASESLITGRSFAGIAIMESSRPRILHITSISDALAVEKKILSDHLDHLYSSASSWFAVNLFY